MKYVTVGSLHVLSFGGSGLTFSFWTVSISLGLGWGGGSVFTLRSLSGDNATPFHFFNPLPGIKRISYYYCKPI